MNTGQTGSATGAPFGLVVCRQDRISGVSSHGRRIEDAADAWKRSNRLGLGVFSPRLRGIPPPGPIRSARSLRGGTYVHHFLRSHDPATGEELWLNSGNVTKLVDDINPGPGWSNPQNLTTVGGTLFFAAYDDTNGYQLWKTDALRQEP